MSDLILDPTQPDWLADTPQGRPPVSQGNHGLLAVITVAPGSTDCARGVCPCSRGVGDSYRWHPGDPYIGDHS